MIENDIIKDLLAGDPETRRDAADRLGNRRPISRDAILALISRLNDMPSVASRAGWALREVGIDQVLDSEEFAAVLSSNNPGVRRIAVDLVERISATNFRAFLRILPLIADDNKRVADRAALTLMPPSNNLPVRGTSPEAIEKIQLAFHPRKPLGFRVNAGDGSHHLDDDLSAVMIGMAWPRSDQLVLAALQDSNPRIRRSLVVGLAWAGEPAMECFSELALNLLAEDLRRIIGLALRFCGPKACSLLTDLLHDPSNDVRLNAIESLSHLGAECSTDQCLSPLVALANDPDREIRLAAIRTLAQIRTSSTIVETTLREIISHDPELEVRRLAIWSLLSCGHGGEATDDLDCATRLLDFYDQDSSTNDLLFRCDFVDLLALLRSQDLPTHFDQLFALTRSRNVMVKRLAVDTLSRLNCEDASFINAITLHLTNLDLDLRESALEAFERLGGQAIHAIPSLVEALRHPAAFIRSDAAKALGLVGVPNKDAIEGLSSALSDPDVLVRLHSAEALSLIETDGVPAINVLIDICKNDKLDSKGRSLAFDSLGRFGLRSSAAIPVAVQILHDHNTRSDLRQAVQRYLREVERLP